MKSSEALMKWRRIYHIVNNDTKILQEIRIAFKICRDKVAAAVPVLAVKTLKNSAESKLYKRAEPEKEKRLGFKNKCSSN